MTPPASSWEPRIARARILAQRQPAAAQALDFYAELASAQGRIADEHVRASRSGETFAASLDLAAAASALPGLMTAIVAAAPEPLASAARALQRDGTPAALAWIEPYWRTREHEDPVRAFIAEALLQPFAEAFAAGRETSNARGHTRCPVCGEPPMVALLREEGQGSRRAFACGFCFTEWPGARVGCPSCGETTFERLAVYAAEDLAGARVDCCETCRSCIKTLLLTRDATAIPIVDDIATLPLDLWAREQGYGRIRPNLLRL